MPKASTGTPMPTTVMWSVMCAAKLPATRPGRGPAQAKSKDRGACDREEALAHRQLVR